MNACVVQRSVAQLRAILSCLLAEKKICYRFFKFLKYSTTITFNSVQHIKITSQKHFYTLFYFPPDTTLVFGTQSLQKKLAQLPAVDMQKVPGSFCCYSNHSLKVIQPIFNPHEYYIHKITHTSKTLLSAMKTLQQGCLHGTFILWKSCNPKCLKNILACVKLNSVTLFIQMRSINFWDVGMKSIRSQVELRMKSSFYLINKSYIYLFLIQFFLKLYLRLIFCLETIITHISYGNHFMTVIFFAYVMITLRMWVKALLVSLHQFLNPIPLHCKKNLLNCLHIHSDCASKIGWITLGETLDFFFSFRTLIPKKYEFHSQLNLFICFNHLIKLSNTHPQTQTLELGRPTTYTLQASSEDEPLLLPLSPKPVFKSSKTPVKPICHSCILKALSTTVKSQPKKKKPFNEPIPLFLNPSLSRLKDF
ncbi:hypothetical protein VP01_4681g1 [Puccinia sorghi]|uniref:Uncharacterized protein n=1 Tax=Puccinia sorghi TaxID=27349 RepID=A0A0L6UN39_9BASI|nr:hypothetical protein VP01_4681g1 [Puccinia sorghi]